MASARRIDVHFHLIPPFYSDAVYEAGRGPAIGRYPDWTPQLALEVMDSYDIEVALTSLAQPGVGFGTQDERGGAGAALQRICSRAGHALAAALRRLCDRPDVEHAGRPRRDRLLPRCPRLRRRFAVRELRREIPRRSGVRSRAGHARRARRGRVRSSRPASLQPAACAGVARLHDGIPVRHHARGGEPHLLRRDRRASRAFGSSCRMPAAWRRISPGGFRYRR